MAVTTRSIDKTMELSPAVQAEIITDAELKSSIAAEDLLAKIRWRSLVWLVGAAALAALDVAAGWFYVASYYGYFHLPLEGLGLSAQEIVAQGARSMLLSLAVVPVAFVAGAPNHRLRQSAPAVALYIAVVAYAAMATSFLSPGDLVVQVAAMVTVASTLFSLRRGFGRLPGQRLLLLAVTILAFSALPVATGIFDASQKASATQTSLRLTTQSPVLPGSVASGGAYVYTDYVLLRESETRYWLLRLRDHHVYSIPKTAVIYIRYW